MRVVIKNHNFGSYSIIMYQIKYDTLYKVLYIIIYFNEVEKFSINIL